MLRALATVVKGVWYRDLLEDQKVAVLDLALATIVTGRRLGYMLTRWLPILKEVFFLDTADL